MKFSSAFNIAMGGGGISTRNFLQNTKCIMSFVRDCSFEDLLGHDNSLSVHQKNLQVLMIEMFKTKHGLNLPFMKEIFCPQTNQYILRNDRDFNLRRVRSVMYGSETVRYRGPQLWCTLPVSIRHSTNLIEFKTGHAASGLVCT